MKRLSLVLVRITAVAALVTAFTGVSRTAQAGAAVGFALPTYVDRNYAGGEPVLINSTKGTLVYSTHQGTTHLYRDGILASFFPDYLAQDRDQVYVWMSSNNGATWTLDNLANTGLTSAYASGFSDPDLTADEGGTIYNTGINLVNDSIFGSTDGGRSWQIGNPDCHDGDRPWLAGGKAGTVYMATDVTEGALSHQIFEGTVLSTGQIACNLFGVPDTDGSTYSGDGKLYYDHHNGNIVEPAVFFDANGNTNGVGISIAQGYGQPFVPHKVATTSVFAHWPAIAIDKADNIYIVWDTDPRNPQQLTGCNGGPAPLPNAVMGAVSRDHGKTWKTFTVTHPASTRVLWPWVVAGDAGKVSVVWYQLDRVADSDCQTANTYVYEATLTNAQYGLPYTTVVNASHRAIHSGQICQGGTTCVATGQDRRLGDFFTNALDSHGCVVIATGDTMLRDPITGGVLPTSRPLFIHQSSGPALVGNYTCH